MGKPHFSDAFAVVLRRRREAAGLSQEALAEKADVHPTYVSLVERQRRNPSLNVAHAFAKALGVSLSKLVREAEEQFNAGKR